MKKAAFFLALAGVLLLGACGHMAEARNQPFSAPAGAGDSRAPVPVEAEGTTEQFCFDSLRIEVSNVCDIRSERMMDDGGEPHDYTVFVCCPGAEATVLNADMNGGQDYEDGLPHAQWGFIVLPDEGRMRITEELNGKSVAVGGLRGVAHLESSLYVLMFETADTPVEPSGVSYDVNGDGILQAWEFPVPTGEAFGLTGQDAALYTAAARAKADVILPRVSGGDTLLMLTYLNVFGQYSGENGETHYICGYGEQYYYDLGSGLADLQNPKYSGSGGGGNPARITLAADGTLVDIQETYDGSDNTERIQELCGPLTDLARALNAGGDFPMRKLVPADDALLRSYLDYYFLP